MALSKSITLVKKSSRKKSPKQCLVCLMVAENAIWERSFTDLSLLSHTAKSLPIDVPGFDVLKQFMAQKIETKAVFDTVEQMLRKACEPPHDQSLHNVRVEHGVELRLSTKQKIGRAHV